MTQPQSCLLPFTILSIMNGSEILQVMHKFWPVYTGYNLIRLGSSSDGGYLVPDCLSGVQLCLSPGTCNDIELEADLARIWGIPSIMCDPEHDTPNFNSSLLQFRRCKIGVTSSEGVLTINQWLEAYGYQDASPLMLSMDIEGGEYEIIPSLSDEMINRFRIFTFEIHFLSTMFRSAEHLARISSIMTKLSKTHDLVHMSPNNHVPFKIGGAVMYDCIELTYLSKSVRRTRPQKVPAEFLPHAMDSLNNSDKPPVIYSAYDLALNNPMGFLALLRN